LAPSNAPTALAYFSCPSIYEKDEGYASSHSINLI
jgi:hypothetical protein